MGERCNGKHDCDDGTDELGCPTPETDDGEYQFKRFTIKLSDRETEGIISVKLQLVEINFK